MIIVTGATGALNGATVDHLLERLLATDVAVVVRDRARAQRFADRGVEVREGGYADNASLPAAFAGADQLLLVSSNDRQVDTVALHEAAITAAVTAGVGRILYTSHQGAAHESPFAPARVHATTEDLLAASGLPWTSLRNGFYAHTLEWALGPWRKTGVVTVPADGQVSWTAREDVAEAAAAVLLAPGAYDGPTTLTAPAAPTFAELAETASQLAGRPITLEVVDAEDWVTAQVEAGQPEPAARFSVGMYDAARDGFFAGATPLLGELLGREPRSARDALAVAAER
ncbi:NAD(P)H-binding protein [Nocardioides hwasunensis]|uniref:NAD(P)H-binding protein n=1 Tax=Nocardioides hwasunensis TaxID=397258 RepID=A0ABR8MFW1_9ACTN|nr:NAD(P)H-binding protein [Nocardioides hwasunensis]MBD3914968.1 NAD(P)H-binding protein [Nocardioides hwasunensis]